MKPQTIFNRAVRHLNKQGSRCLNDNGACAYRGNEGAMCAVGALIPDSLYEETMDESGGKTVTTVMKEYPAVVRYLGADNIDLLRHLQSIHDSVSVERWRMKLLALAAEMGLKTTVMKEWTL